MNFPFCRKVLFSLVALTSLTPLSRTQAQTTALVSTSTSGAVSNSLGDQPSISGDGRLIVFLDAGTNLATGDTNGVLDVFLRDTQAGSTTRLSVNASGVQGNGACNNPRITANGRFVVFDSVATNLVTGDTNGVKDCFLLDRQTGVLECVSLGSGGVQGNGDSRAPVVSEDGRFVAFESLATNFATTGNSTFYQIYLHDRTNGTTVRLFTGLNGAIPDGDSLVSSITPDGRFVTFSSQASNLISGDVNGLGDAFLYDRTLAKLERISVSTSGAGGDSDSGSDGVFPSSDGRYVFFDSTSGNLDPLAVPGRNLCYLRDRVAGTTQIISLSLTRGTPDDDVYCSAMSPDARLFTFDGFATNLVPNDTNGESDAFLYDRASGKTRLLSVGTDGNVGSGPFPRSALPVISANGEVVAFRSNATNLVAAVTDGKPHIYVRGAVNVNVSGTLGLVSQTAAAQNFNFTVTSNGGTPYTLTQSVAPNGAFSFLIESGSSLLHIKNDRYLATNRTVTLTSDGSLGTVPVLAGDTDGNNLVSVDDLFNLLLAFNTAKGDGSGLYEAHPTADFDLNGKIEVNDLFNLLVNFNVAGDN